MLTSHFARFASAATFCASLALSLLAVPAHGQTFSVVASITDHAYSSPSGQIALGRNGDVYAVTPANGWLFSTTTAGTFAGIYQVGGPSGVTLGSDGNLYTNFVFDRVGCGEVDKTSTLGTYSVLASICGNDGAFPYSAPIQASNGIFYGTASGGGSNSEGTIYSVTSSGTVGLLHTFVGTDGNAPTAPLVMGSDGNLYGGTTSGGTNNDGVLFRITPQGVYTVLHNLAGSDGTNISSGLCLGRDGNLYGVTRNGGTDNDGVIFKLTNSGVYTVLYNILNPYSLPASSLVQASDGNLYGVLGQGNASQPGWIYSVSTTGTFTILHEFCQETNCTDGSAPSTPLIQHTNGTLYGLTLQGGTGPQNDGTFYSLNIGANAFISLASTSGKEGVKVGIFGQGFTVKSVVEFGGTQATTVTRSGSTYLIATVPAGALTGAVTVTTGKTTLTSLQSFKVTPTLTTFDPPSGAVGTLITITGTAFTQATKVAFAGRSAAFTVNSDTQITATVPTGATTGKISVTTKGGSASSATSFTVN